MISAKHTLIALFVASAIFSVRSYGQSTEKKPVKLGSTLLKSENIHSLTGRFTRIFAGESAGDTTRGDFFYWGSGNMHIEVDYPIDQIMKIQTNVTTIYYPQSKIAFLLESNNPVILPLIPGLLAAIRPDYGLSDLGFQLKRQEMRGDTLVAFWGAQKGKKQVGQYLVAELNDRLVYTHFHAPQLRSRMKTFFSDYLNVSGTFFPTHIRSTIVNAAEVATEMIQLEALQVNPQIRHQIVDFKLPKDVHVEKKRW